MISLIYDCLSRFAWPLIWFSLALTLIDAFDDHSETTEQLKEASGFKKYWLHTKRIRLWTLPVVLGVGAILAQIGSEKDESKIADLGPRKISEEQQAIILKELQGNSGLVYFTINPTVPDAEQYANSLAKILQMAGYGIIPSAGTGSGEVAEDITVEPNDLPAAIVVKNALIKAGIKVSDNPAFGSVVMGGGIAVPAGTIKIFVGIRSVNGD